MRWAPAVLIGFCGCAAGISRQGYTLRDIGTVPRSELCPIAIKHDAIYEQADVDVVGRIKAFDTSVSVNCDEAYVLDLFCREACALGADLVNVTNEREPDLWSTCYRAQAEFVRFKNRDQAKLLVSDSKYAPELIIERSVKAGKRNRQIIAACVGGGVLGGLIVYGLTSPHDDRPQGLSNPH